MPKLLITIDTEGDNIWNWKQGDKITTKNASFLQRFQILCEKYEFKPVYLTNYEMALDDNFVTMAKNALKKNNCEIGMHLHAVNNPPIYELDNIVNKDCFPYLIEYSEKKMKEKIEFLTTFLNNKFNTQVVTHRAGRWAMNDKYFDILIENGYKVDCSFTPGIDWSFAKGGSKNSCGSNYANESKNPTIIYNIEKSNSIIEIPVSIMKTHAFIKRGNGLINLLKSLKRAVFGQTIWLRPNGLNYLEMKFFVENSQNKDYLMFMLHSSELMPGGSPTFKTDEDIENLYKDIENIFILLKQNKFEGITIKDYIQSIIIS